ncbi:MAG TPA: hypothetical protein VNE41_06785 [Chitinophagaceae bacterium]|nr:hypothetical protein [Chitinophagaceae bacterium]
MNRPLRIIRELIFLTFSMLIGIGSFGQQVRPDPWNASQLMDPGALAMLMKAKGSLPLVLDVGPAGQILHARQMGPAHEAAGMARLGKTLAKVPRDKEIVVYCGCCPFNKCPNIRPAFLLLQHLGFTRIFVLDLSHNLKADWIDKGYPLQ